MNATRLSPDGKRVAVAYNVGDDFVGKLAVWSGKELEDVELGETLGEAEHGTAIAWSPDGKRLAMGTTEGLVYEVPA